MAYRRPAIEVIQEFQQAAAALALPTLPAVVVGPAYQIADDVDAGIYSEDAPGVSSFAYDGLTVGAIVDLSDAPTSDSEANAHKGVGVTLQDTYLIKVNTVATGETTLDTNVLNDPTPGAFSSFDPDAEGAPRFYVDIVSGSGLTLGRRLVISKTDDNNLVVATNFAATVSGAEYRILEFRETEVISPDDFTAQGISRTATAVEIDPGLVAPSDGLLVVEATVLLSWRALRPDLAGALTAFTDLDSLEAEFGVGSIVPSNVGPYAVNLALLNTTTEVNFVGLDAGFFTNEEQAYQDALEYLESTEMYAIAPTTHLAAVHQQLDAHTEAMSVSTVGRERIGFVNRTLVETEVLVPPSGLGNVTTDAGSGNGFEGTLNKTFKDPTNGDFIIDGVGVGDFLQVFSYNVLAEGVERSIVQNIADYLDPTAQTLRLGNAAFVSGDVGYYVLYQSLNAGGNDQAYLISAVTSAELVDVNTTPPAVNESVGPTERVWVASQNRALSIAVGDDITAATRTFDFSTSVSAFTAADVGRLIHVEGVSNSIDGTYTIESIVSANIITVVETPAGDGAFGAGDVVGVYDIVRTVTPDAAHDNVGVDGVRTWTFIDGAFTDADVGRTLRIAGSSGGSNDADHVIASVLGPSQVITDNTTLPVPELFIGIPSNSLLTTIDIVSTDVNASEDAYLLNTLHQIASVDSSTQLTLANDPSGGFAGTLDTVEYRILNNLSLNDQASFLAGYASSFANRRLVHTWPDVLAVSVNGVATKVPGYYAGAVLAGLVAGLPSQSGFTNLAVTGFVGRENSDDKFSDTQLDTIAGGGNFIFTQPVAGAALSIRHQLTTDLSTIFFQELSVTKNVDLIAKFFRGLYRPFLGIYNITDTLLDLLKTRGEGGIQFLKDQRANRVGAPLRRGNLSRIQESSTQPDTVEIDIEITVPLPLNNVKLTLLI